LTPLWRLFRKAHGPGLEGAGGLQAAGRWHELGSPVVYFGASAAIVILEKLAHLDPAVLPRDLVLARFEGDIGVEVLGNFAGLHDLGKARARGEIFLKAGATCALRVPSVVVPEEDNIVVNPLHADAAKIQMVFSRPFAFDGRLLEPGRIVA
jgi:RES domain-containing protein